MRILTVTPNPAIDETIYINKLMPGQVHRAESFRYNVGGKGVNVSSCLADWGLASSATGFLGIENDRLFAQFCREQKVADLFVKIPGKTRVNIKLVDNIDTTDVNLPGVQVSKSNVDELFDKVNSFFKDEPGIVVLSGSLPINCPNDIYLKLIKVLKEKFCKIVLDANGLPLKAVLESPILPDVIKPNIDELSQYAGKKLDLAAALSLGQHLCQRGIFLVCISMGSNGAYFITQNSTLKSSGQANAIKSTVGAGDAMVAGIVAALSENAQLERVARLSTAFAIEKLSMEGARLPEKSLVEEKAENIIVELVSASV